VPSIVSCSASLTRELQLAFRHGLWFAAALCLLALQAVADPLDDAKKAQKQGDFAMALALATPFAEKGDDEAQYMLGQLYGASENYVKSKRNPHYDPAKAIRWYQAAADQGNAEAQFDLGLSYERGGGVKKDMMNALRWYRAAADQFSGRAMYTLGEMYEKGTVVEQDFVAATHWYRLALEHSSSGHSPFSTAMLQQFKALVDSGNTDAQVIMGYAYWKESVSFGVDRNPEEALRWFKSASEAGDAGAQHELAICLMLGYLGPSDAAGASYWFHKAAEGGDAESQKNVGLEYEEGTDGKAKNLAEAARWFRKAADQGNSTAQQELGVLYATGEGVPRDLLSAYEWCALAAKDLRRYGFIGEKSIRCRDAVAAYLTPSQLTQGKAWVKEWKPSRAFVR